MHFCSVWYAACFRRVLAFLIVAILYRLALRWIVRRDVTFNLIFCVFAEIFLGSLHLSVV